MTAIEPAAVSSMAELFKMAFQGVDLAGLRQTRIERFQLNPSDAGALVDLSVVEQLAGNQAQGLMLQAEAFRHQRLYRSSWPASRTALRVLAFMTDGDVSTNTPIDFLLERSDVVLYSLYLAPDEAIPDDLLEHYIAIVTVSESDRARPTLQTIEEQLMHKWKCPVLNRPSRILLHSREEMYRLLRGAPGLAMPPTVRLARAAFQELGRSSKLVHQLLEGATFPLIARPVESHAGRGLEKLESAESVEVYLARRTESEFFVSPYVDYRSQDGLFRKYRIMWIDGRPYPVHMAIANDWKVWYLNAEMSVSEWKRREEESFLSAFESGFGQRHGEALAAISDRFELDYMGIDCGELPDGRLLVFEGSIALAVHDMDSPDLFPYKSPQMQRLFRAFYDMLKRKSKARSV